jgi:hypothetical protein
MKPVYDDTTQMYVTPDGCSHDTPQDAQYSYVLGLCGCGRPHEVHALLIECVKCFERGGYSDKEWLDATGVDGIAELVRAKPKVAAEFIAHFLDQRVLTEHGGSVYGSWITEDGLDFIEAGGIE